MRILQTGGREENREDITEDMLQGFCEGEMEEKVGVLIL
jgi:hypothetical protein